MGVRYSAYAFDRHQTEQAVARPQTILCWYCSEEAFGPQPDVTPEGDVLDLDKAWSALQRITAPAGDQPARPAYRMFEGEPTWGAGGGRSWVRVLVPDEVQVIAVDLERLTDEEAGTRLAAMRSARNVGDVEYVLDHLREARAYAAALASDGRGMVYRIG